jgi:hypothetical protein
MKYLITALLLISNLGHAMGLLTAKHDFLRSNKTDKELQSRPEFGLFIQEESDYTGFGYRSYTGYNYQSWFVTEHYAMLVPGELFKFGIGPGLALNENANNKSLKFILEVKLW